jgi:hypothetical protein
MSDARLRNLERELVLDPARADLHEEHGRLLARAGRADEALAALDLAFRLGRGDLELELVELLFARRVREGPLELAYVPAGPFVMGSDEGDEDERPAHLVRLAAFHVSLAPLRWGDVEPWTGLSPAQRARLPHGRERPAELAHEEARRCLAALAALHRPGRPAYALPTEAQWERVRRAALLTPGRCIYGVETGPPEWARDFYDSTAYGDGAPRLDPTGPAAGEDLVVRGVVEPTLPFTARATYRESADAAGNYEGVAKALPRAQLHRTPGALRLPALVGIGLRACAPASSAPAPDGATA